jgi:hypothetical protein
MPEPILVECVGPHEPHYLPTPILTGAPCGYLCRACGQEVDIDDAGLTVEHMKVDLLAMLARGDYG